MRFPVSGKLYLAAWAFLVTQSVGVIAAPVSDSVSPTQFVAPTATELANVTTLLVNGGNTSVDSLVNPMRSTPTNEVNLGLDAPESATVGDEVESVEVGVIRLPNTSNSCPSTTPVTITVSDWSLTLTGASPATDGAGAGGGVMMDSRNPDMSAPVTSAISGGAAAPANVGDTSTLNQSSFVATFEDLPFLVFSAAITAAQYDTNPNAPPAFISYQAGYRVALPSITLEYDDANCGASVGPSAQAIPSLGLVHLLSLVVMLPLVALRRRCVLRR